MFIVQSFLIEDKMEFYLTMELNNFHLLSDYSGLRIMCGASHNMLNYHNISERWPILLFIFYRQLNQVFDRLNNITKNQSLGIGYILES